MRIIVGDGWKADPGQSKKGHHSGCGQSTMWQHNNLAVQKYSAAADDGLAQLVEHGTAVREVAGSNLDRTNTQSL